MEENNTKSEPVDRSADTTNPVIIGKNGPEHHKHAKAVLIFSFFILLIVVGVSSYYLIQQNDSQTIIQSPKSNTEVTEKVNDEETEVVKEAPQGYLRYVNDDLKLDFVYPETWGNYVEGMPNEYDENSLIIIKFFNDETAPVVSINDASTYYYSVRYSGVDIYYDTVNNVWTSRPTEGVNYVDDTQEFPETKVIGDFTVAIYGFGDAGFSSLNNAFVFNDNIVVLEESRAPEDQDNKYDIFNEQVELFGLGNSN